MRFSGMVSSAVPIRLQKPGLLVIMPVYTEYPVLFEHLEYLKRQTFQRFNLLIVMGDVADGKKVIAHVRKGKYKFGVIVAKRKEDTGPAGAFFAGQKYALENGYGCVVFAESDCFPVDNTLLEELHSKRQSGYAGATVHFFEGDKTVSIGSGMNYYTLLSAENMRRYGLYFLPAHIGSEDIEYAERIRERKLVVASRCRHAFNSTTRYDAIFDKQAYYLLNTMCIQQRSTVISAFTIRFLAVFYCMLFFFPQYGRRLSLTILRLMLSFTYGKAAMQQVRSNYRDFLFSNRNIAGFQSFQRLVFGKAMRPLSEPLEIALLVARHFRKDVIIERSVSMVAVLLLPIGARRAYLQAGKDSYLLLCDNSNPAAHALRLIVFLPTLPIFLAAFAALFAAIKLLRQPQTLKYGL